ncbi:hypothetical protein [Salinicoccus roseus]|uniref:hypothetical protein n=1 Tax=Salinicoccus roseus TaxID=45670 RepID=UPI002301EA97|nr:hypothetical protein [Salinicoccus roseus]
MDPIVGKAVSDVTVFLTQRGYGWLTTKRELVKNAKSLDEQKDIYEEIIDKLLEEENRAKDYALEYKTLYEEVNIKDEDIEYLRQTIERTLNALGEFPGNGKNIDSSDIDTILELVSVDTLKTMQLLGFKYKDAIGKPLTDATSAFIYRKLGGYPVNPEQNAN